MLSLSRHSVYHPDVLLAWVCLLAVSQAYVNVALNKPAYQQYPMIQGDDRYDASNAVDGRKSDLSLYGGQCAASEYEQTATWWVNLTSIHSIHHITIYFVTDIIFEVYYRSNIFLGFSVYVSNIIDRLQGTLCYKDDNFTRYTIPAVFTTTCPVHGQYVIFYNERRPGVTYPADYSEFVVSNLCEVEVYGCPGGFYGTYCSNTCPDNNCYCHIETGTCQGCKPGYQGYLCRKACQYGFFGVDCGDKCKDTCDGCDRFNGSCDSGCKPGWQGFDCQDACDEGLFGDNCSETCGHCCDVMKCSNINGTCLTGCAAGYLGYLCKSQCDKGSYGIDCKETCGLCRENEQCFHTNGTCLRGCIAGVQGGLCKTPCNRGFFGENCAGKCLDTCDDCNDVTGLCDNGCLPGWTGYFCREACPYGYFGQNCTGECNNTCAGCNNVNGLCDRGCHPGWRGDNCDIGRLPHRRGDYCDKGSLPHMRGD